MEIYVVYPILYRCFPGPRMAFLSNIGALVEPLSKEQWESAAGERRPV